MQCINVNNELYCCWDEVSQHFTEYMSIDFNRLMMGDHLYIAQKAWFPVKNVLSITEQTICAADRLNKELTESIVQNLNSGKTFVKIRL